MSKGLLRDQHMPLWPRAQHDLVQLGTQRLQLNVLCIRAFPVPVLLSWSVCEAGSEVQAQAGAQCSAGSECIYSAMLEVGTVIELTLPASQVRPPGPRMLLPLPCSRMRAVAGYRTRERFD